MAKKTSRQAIEKGIRRAIQFLAEGDLEDALFYIAPLIDVTAKERYKNQGVGKRIKEFLRDEQDLIYYLSMQGLYSVPSGVTIMMVRNDDVTEKLGELGDFIYKNVRCARMHDAEIDYELIDLSRNFGVFREGFENDGEPLQPGQIIVSKATVLSLILSVICAPENKRIKLPGTMDLLGILKLNQQDLVGNKTLLMSNLQQIFKK